MKFVRNLIYVVSILALISGCQKEDLDEDVVRTDRVTSLVPLYKARSLSMEQVQELRFNESSDDPIPFRSFSKKNPYTVENMRLAYESISGDFARSAGDSETEIQVTHYYVRFFLKKVDHYELLDKLDLVLHPYPLDIDLVPEVVEKINKGRKEKNGAWFYTSVPVDFKKVPGIKMQILDELFLPEDLQSSHAREFSDGFLEALEEEANEIAGVEKKSTARALCLRAAGYIKVEDNSRNREIGAQGATVRGRRWFTYTYGQVGSNGYYRLNRCFERDVNYSIIWETGVAKIWRSTINIGVARYELGKHSNRGYSYVFRTNSNDWRCATVCAATAKYLYRDGTLGVWSPPSDLRIIAQDQRGGGGAAPMFRHVKGAYGFNYNNVIRFLSTLIALPGSIALNEFGPDVMVDAHTSVGTRRVFEVTFHELAHASHFSKAGRNYWVRYINYIASYGAYGNGTGRDAGVAGIGEMWGNFFGDEVFRREFGFRSLNEGEDWFNPGFLRRCSDITDLSVSEIYSSLGSSIDTFDELVAELKKKTNYDSKVDDAWSAYNDWPST